MDNLEDKTSNDILFEIKQMQADYDSLKIKMIKDYDKLVELEKRFELANKILLKRLKGDV